MNPHQQRKGAPRTATTARLPRVALTINESSTPTYITDPRPLAKNTEDGADRHTFDRARQEDMGSRQLPERNDHRTRVIYRIGLNASHPRWAELGRSAFCRSVSVRRRPGARARAIAEAGRAPVVKQRLQDSKATLAMTFRIRPLYATARARRSGAPPQRDGTDKKGRRTIGPSV